MKKPFNHLAALIIIGSLASCKKRELPVPAHDPGNVTTATVNMESDYRWQIYYSLQSNTVVSRNRKTAWDVAFEASPAGWHVVLNSAKFMMAIPLRGKSVLAGVTAADTAGYSAGKRWDAPSGNLDSTAIGDWRAVDGTYIIDRGYDETGRVLGFEKLQIRAVSGQAYNVVYAPLGSSATREITIAKDDRYNLMFLSFDSSATTIIEPPKASWDMVFTQYTHTFYQPEYQPYLVTGCLLNRAGVSAVVVDSARSFSGMEYSDIGDATFSQAINIIGYDWKAFTGSTYLTNAAKSYIVRDAQGYYYKLHFTDFLNSAGVKGNPKWEYQRL